MATPEGHSCGTAIDGDLDNAPARERPGRRRASVAASPCRALRGPTRPRGLGGRIHLDSQAMKTKPCSSSAGLGTYDRRVAGQGGPLAIRNADGWSGDSSGAGTTSWRRLGARSSRDLPVSARDRPRRISARGAWLVQTRGSRRARFCDPARIRAHATDRPGAQASRADRHLGTEAARQVIDRIARVGPSSSTAKASGRRGPRDP